MLLNNIYRRLGIVSLKGRLRSLFISFIIIMVIVAAVPFVYFVKKYIQEEAKETIEKTIQLQQVVIDNWFEDRMSNIQALSGIPNVKEFDLERMALTFKSFDNSHSEFEAVIYVNEDGISEISTSGSTGLDLSDRQYFLEAKKGNVFISDVLIGRQSETQIIIVSNPIYDSKGVFRGLILGAVPLTTINDVMSKFYGDSSETYIVDRNGMLITKSRQNEIGDVIQTNIYKNALESIPSTHFYESASGEKVLGSYRWVHNDRWLIIGEITEDKINTPFYRMAFMFILIILFGSIVGLILLKLVSSQIERPIQNVLEGARSVSEHKFNYRLDRHFYEKEAVEFQELCDSFNDMNAMIESYIVSLEVNEERFRMITEYSSDMITIHDSTGKYMYVSAAGKEILQYEDHEVIGYDSYLFIHPDDIEMTNDNFRELLADGYVVATYRIRRKDGQYIWFESSLKFLKGKTNELQIIGISRNITERKEAEQKLEEANRMLKDLSEKDGLTGIWNRRAFDEQLNVEWHRASLKSQMLSLIMLDIDYFKKYNDTYGHQAGDICLKQVANALELAVWKTEDVVFRYGGEEFVVILPGADVERAERIGEMIRKTVESLAIPHSASEISQFVTISLGVNSIVPNEEKSIEQFIEGADQALYQAKQSGRNRCRSFVKQ